jgi:archaellum component FlaG (FlaF/FlaG flagellin family)
MNVLIIIPLIIAGIIALLFIIALLMRKEHYVKREIVITMPRQKVFDYLKLLKNQDKFNKHAMNDPDRNFEYKGTDGTIGFIIAWSGDKSAGVGEKEIISLVEGESIETEIRFVKPMKTSARIIMELESLADNETKVSWSNTGKLFYPINIMIPKMEKHVAKDMDSSLMTLKSILEK